MLTAFSKSLRWQFPKVLLIVLLAGLVCLGTLPGYLAGGKWRWQAPPQVKVLRDLKELTKTGLAIPGWQTLKQKTQTIGEHEWLQQELSDANQTKATLLLLPQRGSTRQPQVEWTDINGFKGWRTDSQRQVELGSQESGRFTVQFLRAWTPLGAETLSQTYAVMQWYAWTNGGHPSPSRWFFTDRFLQWQNRRAAWVAVSLLLPIEPLDDVEKYRSTIEPLAQTVQSTLMTKVLRPDA